jgi:hypothetical protein
VAAGHASQRCWARARVTRAPRAQVRRVHESRHPHRPLPMSDAKLAEVIRSAAASAILSMQREASTSFCAPALP